MPREPRKPLTALKVRTLKTPGWHSDADSRGLYLVVDKPVGENPPRKHWAFLYTRHGKRHELSIGRPDDVTLAEARAKAREQRRLLDQKIDPLEARRTAAAALPQAPSFQEAAEAFVANNAAGWRNKKHVYQWKMTLGLIPTPRLNESYLPQTFLAKPVDQISLPDVKALLDPIWTTKTETASRLRARIESVLDYAAAHGWRSGENPARWKGGLGKLLPAPDKITTVEHYAALPWTKIPEFMQVLRDRPGMGALALRFAILTAARSGEVRGATWPEIDLEAKVWTVPAERIKGGREHRVPLSEPALAILDGRKNAPALGEGGIAGGQSGALVFPGIPKDGKQRPLSDMSLTATLRRMGREDLTAHGFRSSFRDWCAEATNFPHEATEMALAHIVADKVEAAYRRGDLLQKRIALMAAWAAYCDGN
jgi:integrase